MSYSTPNSVHVNTKDVALTQTLTTTTTGAASPSGNARILEVQSQVTAASGTTPSLTVAVQTSNDGVTWYAAPGATLAAQTANGTVVGVFVLDRQFRFVYTISGTTPSFTFTVSSSQVGGAV